MAHPSIGRWALFAAIAIGVVVVDQLAKAWIVGNLAVGESCPAARRLAPDRPLAQLGDPVRDAPAVAPARSRSCRSSWSALIVCYHAEAGRGLLVTIALGLLLGGAIGNLLDRLHYGSVVDFVDMGIGTLRFFTYNVADAGDHDGDPAADGDGGVPGARRTGRRMTEAGAASTTRRSRTVRRLDADDETSRAASSPSRRAVHRARPATAHGPRGRGRPPRRPLRRRPDGPLALVRPEADQRGPPRRRRGAAAARQLRGPRRRRDPRGPAARGPVPSGARPDDRARRWCTRTMTC